MKGFWYCTHNNNPFLHLHIFPPQHALLAHLHLITGLLCRVRHNNNSITTTIIKRCTSQLFVFRQRTRTTFTHKFLCRLNFATQKHVQRVSNGSLFSSLRNERRNRKTDYLYRKKKKKTINISIGGPGKRQFSI